MESIELSYGQSTLQEIRTNSITSEHGPSGREQPALPPTDEGYQAWLSLAGSFLSNGLIWGFALSFGVLQEYYTTNEPFASHPEGIAAIGTTATGLMYLTMPVFLGLFQRWPRLRQYALWASLPIVAVALIGASFANTVPQLIVCQGIIYAIAGNALVMPSINFINEWFVRKKGLAIGVAIAGDGTGGVFMPLILQALLPSVGFRWVSYIVALAGVSTLTVHYCRLSASSQQSSSCWQHHFHSCSSLVCLSQPRRPRHRSTSPS